MDYKVVKYKWECRKAVIVLRTISALSKCKSFITKASYLLEYIQEPRPTFDDPGDGQYPGSRLYRSSQSRANVDSSEALECPHQFLLPLRDRSTAEVDQRLINPDLSKLWLKDRFGLHLNRGQNMWSVSLHWESKKTSKAPKSPKSHKGSDLSPAYCVDVSGTEWVRSRILNNHDQRRAKFNPMKSLSPNKPNREPTQEVWGQNGYKASSGAPSKVTASELPPD
ncbi:hypothetical protein RF11_07907 [Thelohanellus kitauei]|uniref:Uncharacterized protein n=1 Tax=Thelohanellus kitauei TaxID=669202 RepID=A0A0C2MNM1_THEKT|nr:hypothetical protein RF11_07907 [Thelohanellus kitauei]